MRAEKIWWNGINGIHKKLALKISGLKWRPQNGRESKYRMERIVANILNGYVDLQTHRGAKFILEHEMMER